MNYQLHYEQGQNLSEFPFRGHLSEVMDLNFSSQLNAIIWMIKNRKGLKLAIYEFPKELDKETALPKLSIKGVE